MTTWILLRGLTREAGHWGHFPEELRRTLGDARVVAIDLPGAGRLHDAQSPTRIEDIATRCREQALVQGLQPPFNLVALSLGAMVAVAWAKAHCDEIAAAVLINTSLGAHCPPWDRLRPRNYRALLRYVLAANDRTRERVVFDLTCTNTTARDDTIDEWVAIRRQRPVSMANALRQLYAAARYRPRARPALRRLLVLAGRGDALVAPACSRRLALAWQASYGEHPNAGHDLTHDDAGWVGAQIAKWWTGIDATADSVTAL
ncbi:MAG: alpha/beta hydrolase [Rhodocyclales bacterium]|nr:alpha/beta hydrolase [Rhodocyclales bacterium]